MAEFCTTCKRLKRKDRMVLLSEIENWNAIRNIQPVTICDKCRKETKQPIPKK